jgi:hypothetical protein
MNPESRMTNPSRAPAAWLSGFGIRHSFVIQASTFDIPRRWQIGRFELSSLRLCASA